MSAFRRHGARILITLVPVLFALLHASGVLHLSLVERLDNIFYDIRLRATGPGTLDDRIVIVDIDDASLQQLGQWPWSRDKLARLTTEIMKRQQAAVLGFDVVFPEADDSSGLSTLRELAQGPLRDTPGFNAAVRRLAPGLDRDAIFANALTGHAVSLGYYFTRTSDPRALGLLPEPVMVVGAQPHSISRWNGYGANLPILAKAAPAAGFINVAFNADDDGVVRATPLLARYEGISGSAPSGYYESLALAVYRLYTGSPSITALLAHDGAGAGDGQAVPIEGIALGQGASRITVPLGPQASALVPFRGAGGVTGGSFRYISATRIIRGDLPAGELRGKIVLVGTTAPGLQDLRATPMSTTYPGVEVHASIVSGILDNRILRAPDYAAGYDVITLFIAGLVLAFGLTLLPAWRALWLAILTLGALVTLNTGLFLGARLVLPLAAAVLMTLLALALSMSWGYLVEERDRRRLAELFGTYVPPELVDEMLTTGRHYSMRAESRELTVMFCDMRGFTMLSEHMEPLELQAFLNNVFSRLTHIIRDRRGTVDKYMGDCVMAFWGAPVDTPNHAELAVQAAIDMAQAVHQINNEHRADGWPEISVGIGLNTGVMSVGDMGSTVRRSYTVVGDAVNLASRLEGLADHYGVDIVASEATRAKSPAYFWQELDLVRVKGRAQTVPIFTPLELMANVGHVARRQQTQWSHVLAAYRAQDCTLAQAELKNLLAVSANNVLYLLYSQRLASMASSPRNPTWDGVHQFDTK